MSTIIESTIPPPTPANAYYPITFHTSIPTTTTSTSTVTTTSTSTSTTSPTQGVLLFYIYTPMDTKHAYQQQHAWCTELSLNGRMRIACEGMNATLDGEIEALKNYMVTNTLNIDTINSHMYHMFVVLVRVLGCCSLSSVLSCVLVQAKINIRWRDRGIPCLEYHQNSLSLS